MANMRKYGYYKPCQERFSCTVEGKKGGAQWQEKEDRLITSRRM